MDIFEDDLYLPEDDKDKKAEASEKIKEKGEEENEVKEKSDPGTRIIFQAPEKGAKRSFTGFKDEKDEPKVEPEDEIEELEEEPINEYKGGYAFEEELRKGNSMPRKRQPPKAAGQTQRNLSFEEEKMRRYKESLMAAEKEKAEAAMLAAQQKREKLINESESEIIIDIDGEKKQKKTTGEKVRLAVICLSVIAMAASAGILIKQYVQKKQSEDWQQEVTGLIIDVEEDTTKKSSSDKKDKDKNKEESTTERVLTIEEQWAQLYSDYPDVQFPEGLSLKYAKLYAVNRDFVGYLTIKELGIELPVVQSQKDTATENYYLRRNFYKQYSVYGCPFVPKTNDMVNLDRNTVIYGHNNSSNIAFAPLNKYKTLDGFKSAPVIQFDTIYSAHKWKVFAAFIINTEAKDDDGYIFDYTFMKMSSNEEFMTYIQFLKERSLYDTGIDIMPTDKILTLSTCTHDFDNARFVVVARLVRPGETEDVNTSIAKTNESPRYPQAYYDKKNKKNPYKNAEKWFYSGS